MPDIDLHALSRTVLWATFALTFLFGAILQRTHFCTMGAVSDAVNIGDWSRLRMWALAIGVAMIGTGILGWAGGSIRPRRSMRPAGCSGCRRWSAG